MLTFRHVVRDLTIAVLCAPWAVAGPILSAPAAVGAGASRPTAPSVMLSYLEFSSGLGTPQMESGLTELAMGDVDGDGNVDLVSIGDHGNPLIGSQESGIMVWFGNGAGSWTSAQTGNFGYGGISLADADGDGTMDAVYGMHHNYSATDFGDQILEVARGDGSGHNWIPWDDGLATNGETYGMFATGFADADDDGDLDLASLSFGCCNGVHVYLNRRDGTWAQSFATVTGNSTTNELSFGDVNGDGAADFAAGFQHGTVWLGDGKGGFSLADGNLPAGGLLGRKGSFLADVNRDGKQDLSLVNGGGGVDIWLWSGSNTWTKASTGLPATGSYSTAQMNDMDGDGFMDVVAFGAGTVTVWLGNGGTSWSQAASFSVGSPGTADALRLGDADHNGRPDIALVASIGGRNQVKFYRETTTAGSLTVRGTSPRGGEALAQGSVRFIEWAGGVPAGSASTVRLELSTSGPAGPWSLIANNLPNNGRYQWIVPVGTVSTSCFIRYTVTSTTSVSAISMAPFSIVTVDSDSDGFANWQDCAPGDASAHAAPVEVADVTVARDPVNPASRVIAAWSSQAASAGPGTVYDVITGPISDLGPDGVLDLASCAANDSSPTTVTLALPLPAGATDYILIRAQNVCGIGTWGAATSGTVRTATACP